MTLLRSSLVVGAYTLLSRVLGYARDILIARALGTTGVVEAFVVAFRLPNLFRRLVAEGAFASAFVPLFAKRLEGEGKAAARAFAERALSLLLFVLVIATVLAEIFMREIVAVLAPGFLDQPEIFDAAVLFSRLTMPYLACMAIVALMSGVLNSVYKFAAAAFAPSLLNLVMIAGLLWAQPWFKTPGHLLSWAIAIGGIAQYLLLGWACWRAGIALRLPWPKLTADMKRLLALMVPGVIGAGMQQINLVVGTIIASFLAGAVSILYFADRLYQFPLSMIGIAIGTALLPELARRLKSDPASAGDLQNRAVELSMLLTLPAAAALVALAQPICATMFEYGKFSAQDTARTASALAWFSAGLPAYVLIRVLSPGFYAREDTKSPVYYGVASLVANTVLAIALVWPPFGWKSLDVDGIAIATAIAAWVNAGLLAYVLHRRGHWRPDARLAGRLPRILLCALLMAGALVPAAWALRGFFAESALYRFGAIGALVAGGMILYFALCLVLRAAGLGEFKRLIPRRRKKNGGNGGTP